MADHNDPNAVNSIFSDIDVSAADVYDLFGYPSPDTSEGVLVARMETVRHDTSNGGHRCAVSP